MCLCMHSVGPTTVGWLVGVIYRRFQLRLVGWLGFVCAFNTDLVTSHHYTHTRLMALFPGLPGCAGTRKVKPIWILLKQETVSGSGISWAICKSASRSRQITTPATHHSVFLQARCPSCHPANSIKALKGYHHTITGLIYAQ